MDLFNSSTRSRHIFYKFWLERVSLLWGPKIMKKIESAVERALTLYLAVFSIDYSIEREVSPRALLFTRFYLKDQDYYDIQKL